MAKTAKEKELEKQMSEAEAKKAGEIAQAQIEVYEGQNYEAKNAYQEAKSKRGTARSKLPEEIPTDPYYKERLLEAQYIKANISSPEHSEEHKHVASYTAEIKKQQKAKETIQVLDKQMPQLYASAVAESEAVEAKAEKAKVAETKKQEELITGFQTAIVTEQKAEAKRVADEKARLDAEAQVREDAYKKYMKGAGSGTNKHVSKSIHYGSAGIAPQKGDIILKAGKGITHVSFHSSYYERALENYHSKGGMFSHMTLEDVKTVSRAGIVSKSGKSKETVMRGILDKTGALEEAYQQQRAQAKKNVASAYGSMSAQEKLSSSATQHLFATNHDMSASEISQKNEAKKAVQLEALSDMTGGLLGKKKYQVTEDKMTVYETDELYKTSGGTMGTRKDVTAQVMPIIIKQQEIELANRRQQEYVKELRAGNIGIANALTNPQTTQSYKGTSTVNLGTFLKERGLTAKTAPDSMFKPDYSEKLEKARAQAKVSGDMGDLRTQSGMFVGKPNQSYQMQKASGKEIGERKNAQRNIDVFKAQVFNTQKNEDSNAIRFTHLPDPTVGTIGMGKPNDVLEQKGQSYFGVTPHQIAQDKIYDYNVISHAPVSFTTMGGKTFQAYTPVTFDTKKEADEYDKARPKEKVFSGTDNDLWNKFQYASAVDSGEVIHPRETPSLLDDVRYYANVINRPLINLGASVVNLTQPEDKQIPIYQTGSERLIGGTIDDVASLDPMKGTGVTGAYNYVAEDPLRAVLELPAEAVMWVGGGKAVSLGVKGISSGIKIAGQVGSNIVQSNAPRIITIPTMAVMGAGSAVKTGAQVIQKAPENIWLKGTEASTTLKSIDKSLAYVGGQRVGMGTAMNLRYTFGGRKLLKEAKTTSRQQNKPIPLMEGKIFTIKQIEDPVVIKSKNVIEVPIKETDESIFHVRNTQQTAQAVKVGNVQQYYKTATSSFTNVPKQGLSLPKFAPKLPSLDPMKRWVAKTQKNVELVEAKGYGAMLSGGNVKLKVVEKGMKIKDAKQIAQAEAEGKIRDAKLMALGKKYQAEKQMDEMIMAGKKKLDPLSEQARQDNAWGKLSQIKAETKVKLSEMKKGITDRPATEELILYREATKTTATKSIARSTAEPLTESYTPIKTSITHTKTTTDFTTGKVVDPMLKKFTVDGKPITKFVNEDVSLSVGKTQPNLEIVGEQVRIPFKDYKTIKAVDQANLDRLYEQGKYAVLEKGKLVEKKVEVRALQQEDVDETLIRRNTLTGTGEKIQESSVREWGGTKKTLYGDVEVGGQKSDVILKSLNKKVLTTKLSPLKSKKPSVVEQRQTSQTDDTAVWTGGSTSGNPMTGKGTTVPEFGGKGKPSAPEKTGTFNPDGTVTVNKSNIISSPVKGKAKEVMKDYSTTWKSTKSPYNSATVGSAIIGGITIDTVSGLTPKDMIKTGVDTGVRIDTGIQSKIDTKVETGLKQDTVQKTLTEQQSRLQSKIKIDTGLKLDTISKQMTATASVPLLQVPLRTKQSRTPKVLPIILPRIDLEDKPAKRGKRGKKKGFIGNVRLDNIMGMYKRKEITYGQKKVTKLERLDMRLTSKTPNRISQPSSKLLKSKKKKKPKTETDLLGNVSLKSKSDFKGFTENKQKKTKKKRKTKRVSKPKVRLI